MVVDILLPGIQRERKLHHLEGDVGYQKTYLGRVLDGGSSAPERGRTGKEAPPPCRKVTQHEYINNESLSTARGQGDCGENKISRQGVTS